MMSKGAALITGAARRLGKAMAIHLAERGFDIALHYNRSEKDAEEVRHIIRKKGVACKLFCADLTQLPSLPALMSRVFEAFPHCNCLINNASVFERKGFMQSDTEFYAKMLRINLDAPVFLTQAFAKQCATGQVINMLDTAVDANKHAYFFYLLAKKTLADFTLMAAAECAPGLRVNGICPGTILPSEDGRDVDYIDCLKERLPLKSIATLQALTQTLDWLMACESVTGQLVYLDGGEHLL